MRSAVEIIRTQWKRGRRPEEGWNQRAYLCRHFSMKKTDKEKVEENCATYSLNAGGGGG